MRESAASNHFEEPVSSDLNHVSEALRDARRELIDLSRRNRLLHTPQTAKRPHCLEIIDIDGDELFGALTRNGKQFGFRPLASDESTGGEVICPSGQPVLQTKLTEEVLARLLKFFREARTFEEEQGVNVLFLAIGFLQ